jgi:hypothetical protein
MVGGFACNDHVSVSVASGCGGSVRLDPGTSRMERLGAPCAPHQEDFMQASTIVWIIVAIVVIAIIVVLVMRGSGTRRAEAERAKAAEIREAASQHDRELREREASAAEARAQAEMAKVEAQKRELDAERLAAEADDHSDSAAAIRQRRDEQARLADLRDPDVRTDDEGYRIDEQGNRIDAADVRGDSYADGRSGDAYADGRSGDAYAEGRSGDAYAEGRSGDEYPTRERDTFDERAQERRDEAVDGRTAPARDDGARDDGVHNDVPPEDYDAERTGEAPYESDADRRRAQERDAGRPADRDV